MPDDSYSYSKAAGSSASSEHFSEQFRISCRSLHSKFVHLPDAGNVYNVHGAFEVIRQYILISCLLFKLMSAGRIRVFSNVLSGIGHTSNGPHYRVASVVYPSPNASVVYPSAKVWLNLFRSIVEVQA